MSTKIYVVDETTGETVDTYIDIDKAVQFGLKHLTDDEQYAFKDKMTDEAECTNVGGKIFFTEKSYRKTGYATINREFRNNLDSVWKSDLKDRLVNMIEETEAKPCPTVSEAMDVMDTFMADNCDDELSVESITSTVRFLTQDGNWLANHITGSDLADLRAAVEYAETQKAENE